MEVQTKYRFNLRAWLHPFSKQKKRMLVNQMVNASGQSRFTIRRIMYMKRGDDSHVRQETKAIICQILNRDLSELENPIPNNDGK